ncbi:MAG: DUF502 domain-containing protein [Ignavibacteria bacterium]|nr:DUF502 domain-containing protein [Ignavibacteria bacterium]
MIESLKKTFYEGFILMIPLFLGIFVLQQIFGLITELLKPLIEILPESPILGNDFTDLRALIAFIIIVFLCGLLVRIGLGKYFVGRLSSLIMRIVPGHSVFEKIISEEAKIKDKNYKSVVFANIDDAWAMGLIIEEKNEEGFLMVFIPSAPVPTGGNLYMMKEEQIKRTEISVNEALKFIWHLGKESDKVLKDRVKW